MSNREETNLLKLKEEGVIAHMRNAAFDGCTCGVCEAVRELIREYIEKHYPASTSSSAVTLEQTSDALQSAAAEIARKFSAFCIGIIWRTRKASSPLHLGATHFRT